jgi:hypothetical protein
MLGSIPCLELLELIPDLSKKKNDSGYSIKLNFGCFQIELILIWTLELQLLNLKAILN